MVKLVIFEVFGAMQKAQLVRSEQEFCRVWLGRSECYLRTIRFKQAQPSLGTLALCADRLWQGSKIMQESGDTKAATLLNALSLRCRQPLTMSN